MEREQEKQMNRTISPLILHKKRKEEIEQKKKKQRPEKMEHKEEKKANRTGGRRKGWMKHEQAEAFLLEFQMNSTRGIE